MGEIYRKVAEKVRGWITRQAQGPHASPFLFVFSFAETLFSPIPVEVALVPLVLTRARSWGYYAFIATVGSTLGGLAGYFIGLFFYDTVGVLIIQAYSFEEEVLQIQTLLTQHVFTATFLAAFTPLPDKIYMPIAGFLQAPFLIFVIALTFGRTARSVLVAYLTHRFGALAARLALRYFAELTLIAALLALLFFVV